MVRACQTRSSDGCISYTKRTANCVSASRAELFRGFEKFPGVKKLLALLLALWDCEFVTPYPSATWSWRRRSELNRRIQLLQSRALPLGYSAHLGAKHNRVPLARKRKLLPLFLTLGNQ